MDRINLADAEGHLSELVDRVSQGETIDLVRDGETVARLSAPKRLVPPTNPQPFDWAELERLTSKMTPQSESAGDFIRRMRDEGRY